MGMSIISPPGANMSQVVVDADLDMGGYDLKTDDVKESSAGVGVDVDGVKNKDSVLITPGVVDATAHLKVASDNNRHTHSYDGNRAPDASAYVQVAGMVFTNGIKGTLRVETDISSTNNTAKCEIKYKVDGVGKGVFKQSNHIYGTYTTVTQDIVLDIPAGGELELWMRCLNDVHTVYAKNWKIDYDNAADNVVVAQTEA